MNQRLTPVIITLLLAVAFPSQAKTSDRDPLEDSLAVAVVRENIVFKGITACQAGEYGKAIQFLQTFLNPRKVVATPLEKEGFNCLASAYQNVGEEAKATETIIRAISLFENSPIELADFENTAGIIAYLQNRKILANKHWKKARQIYSTHNVDGEWAKTTLNLAKSYKELGDIRKYRQLLKELKGTTLELDGSSN